jgi:hypothetical protein
VFEIGKRHYGKERLREWFQAAYETLLGSSQGPRLGSFIALYGIENSRRLIAEALTADATSPSGRLPRRPSTPSSLPSRAAKGRCRLDPRPEAASGSATREAVDHVHNTSPSEGRQQGVIQ